MSSGKRLVTILSLARTLVRASPLVVAPLHAALLDDRSKSSKHSHQREGTELWSADFWWHMLMSAGLVILGGIFAGLTLGLMGLDELHLRVLSVSSDDEKERKYAKRVLKLLKKGRHWVLVCLLLGNVIVNESLPIFLDSAIGGGVAAVIISTAMIVIFGEVIPQSFCARYGLRIGAFCAPMVLVFMYLLGPIAYPIAKLLDYVLGEAEGTQYKKAELKSFLQFHRAGAEPLRDDEITILNGVLSLNDKHVEEIMTPLKDVVTLSNDTILDHKTIDYLLLSGFSRFPVHTANNATNFIGTLLIKKLITYDPSDNLPVSAFQLSILPEARREINCFQALDYFQTGRAHMLLISDKPGESHGALGVVTLEDIIEEIIEEEIIDETDRFESNRSRKKAKRMSTAAVMKGIVEREKGRRLSLSRTISDVINPSSSTQTAQSSEDVVKPPVTFSLVDAATETSSLLRGKAIKEIPPESQANGATGSDNGGEQNGHARQGTYGATLSSSPKNS